MFGSLPTSGRETLSRESAGISREHRLNFAVLFPFMGMWESVSDELPTVQYLAGVAGVDDMSFLGQIGTRLGVSGPGPLGCTVIIP